MKTSEALRLTKKHLFDSNGEITRYEAYAVCTAAYKAGVHSVVAPIIRALLKNDYPFLGNWLRAKHGIRPNLDAKKYQQTRHAWVDHLIEHYESIGD